MRFPILKTHINIKLLELKRSIQEFEISLEKINLGENYVSDGVNLKFTEIARHFYQLKELQDEALRFYDEFCDCGSGLTPCTDDGKCKECLIISKEDL
jgi:hypothetical protein